MNENEYQKEFLAYVSRIYPKRTYAPHLELKYEVGKYSKGKSLGMPDTILDVVEFDEGNNFHLWELKLLEAGEVWTGKFFGQMMLYHFLFSTEPWNELLGRFTFCGQKADFKGALDKLLTHLVSFGEDEIAKEGDPTATFQSWNLCVCGGHGYEIAEGYNPVSWSFLRMADEYFEKTMPPLRIWHFFQADSGFVLAEMRGLSVYARDGLHPHSRAAYQSLGKKGT
jgi:hypothetical protein